MKQGSPWRNQESATRRIFAAVLTVGGLSSVVKLVGAAKVLVLAGQFGLGDALDAFLIAFLLPSFLAEVISGAASFALIPTLVEVRERAGHAAAGRLFSSVLFVCAILLLGASLALIALMDPLLRLLGSGFNASKLELARTLLLILLPILPLSGIASVWRGALNACDRFAVAASVPALTPLASIVFLFVFGASWGVYALAAGTLTGCVLEGIVVAWSIRRERLPLWPRWSGVSPELRQVAQQFAPMLAGTAILNGSLVVNQAMAAMLGPGSVSALNYGNKLITVILSIGPVALGTAALPHFSRLVARKDWHEVRGTMSTYVRLILATTVPCTLALLWFSEAIVRMLFERGAFTASDTALVATVQRFYLLSLPFAMLSSLAVRVISSMKANQILMWGAALGLTANVVGNYLFMPRFGVAGIALSTALVSTIYYCYVTAVLIRLLRSSNDDARLAERSREAAQAAPGAYQYERD